MSDVKRYGVFDLLHLTLLGDERFVYASDYDALLADRDRLAAECELLKHAITDTIFLKQQVTDLLIDRDRLAAELAKAEKHRDEWMALYHEKSDELHDKSEQLSAARPDAERYRWLCGWREWPEAVEAAFDCSGKVLIDIAIDAAMAAVIEDGFGNAWTKCKPDCRMEIVRPGKVQCDCDSYRAASSANPVQQGE